MMNKYCKDMKAIKELNKLLTTNQVSYEMFEK